MATIKEQLHRSKSHRSGYDPACPKCFDDLDAVLKEYDKQRKAEGYRIAYRRYAEYQNISRYGLVDLTDGSFGLHCETLYLHDSKPSLLVKVMEHGDVMAFEAVR